MERELRTSNMERLRNMSVEEMACLFDDLTSKAQEESTHRLGVYELFNRIASQVPGKIPIEAQEKALDAMRSTDRDTIILGNKAFLLLNAKTLITVVDSFFISGKDNEEDRDEMMSTSVVNVISELRGRKDQKKSTSNQINNATRAGIENYLSTRGNIYFTSATNIEESQSEEDSLREVINKFLKEDMNRALKTLNNYERRVLELRFGLRDGEPRTLEATGAEFGVTRERIRQIEAKAFRKLSHLLRIKKMRDYISDDPLF